MAAEQGTLTLLGKSGRTYQIDLYLPDAVAAQWTFNANGVAASTSPSTFNVPEDCVITDLSVITGTTAVGVVLQKNNASVFGGTLRYANHLNSVAFRPNLRIPLSKGDLIGGVQI